MAYGTFIDDGLLSFPVAGGKRLTYRQTHFYTIDNASMNNNRMSIFTVYVPDKTGVLKILR